MEPLQRAIEPFRRQPRRAALLFDVDGTLAPIVPTPAQSAVPAETRALLVALSERYGLVGCISGRRALEAAELVDVPGLAYAGNHGLETVDGGVLHAAREVEPFLEALRRVGVQLVPIAAAAGGWVEDKGVTLAVHFRNAPDPEAARALLDEEAVALAQRYRLQARFGRMVLEIRPPVAIDKGTAVKRLLRGRRISRTLYVGDDTTDLDAFRVVDLAVAVRSPEAPEGLEEAADLSVEGTEGVVELMRLLAGDATP